MRKYLSNYPMLGWVVAVVMMLGAAFLLYRQFATGETRELTQMVTIRCNETGETWQMPRGQMETELYTRHFPVDPNEGLVNPKTGKPTGFPVDDWKVTVERINKERKAMTDSGASPFGAAPSR